MDADERVETAQVAPEVSQEAAKPTKKENGRKNADIKFIPKPDKAEKEKKIAEIDAKIAEITRERSLLEASLQEAKKKDSPERTELETLNKEIKKLNIEKDEHIAERDALRAKEEEAKKQYEVKRQELQKMRKKLRFQKLADIDTEIEKLSMRQKTISLALKEEKLLVKEIETLKSERKKIDEVQRFANQLETESHPKNFQEEIRAKDTEIKSLLKKINEKRNERTALNEKLEKGGNKLKKIHQKLQKSREALNGLYDEKKAFLSEWKIKNDEYFEFKKVQQKERKERERQRREEEQKRREEVRKQKEEEELKKKPWEEEIALCDSLVAYLEKLLKSNDDVSESNDQNGVTESEVTDLDGLKPVIKKKDFDGNYMVMGAKGNKKARKQKKKKDDRLTHTLDLINSFEQLSLDAPIKVADIPHSIEQLKEKRNYYDTLPRAPKAEGTEDSKASRKDKSARSSNVPSVASAELFPILPGSRSPVLPQPTFENRRSAVDLVKSNMGSRRGSGNVASASRHEVKIATDLESSSILSATLEGAVEG